MDKKKGTDAIPGFSPGSFSELRITHEDEWTPQSILKRGIEFLRLIEKRWSIELADDARKRKLLRLEFLPTESA